MYFTDAGYSDTHFNTAKLRNKAKALALVLPGLMERNEVDAVVVTGKSGMSLAFATLMLIDFPLVVVRKRGENSHGNNIEGPRTINVRRYIVLDDFISSGATVRTIVQDINDLATALFETAPECVGVLQYMRDNRGTDIRTHSGNCGSVYVPAWGMVEHG